MTIDVSVIVAAYNAERYIERSLQSALSQEGPSLEVLVVDDASTDATWERIRAFGDPRLRAIRLPRNAGPSGARNAAIERATGRWLAVLDGDDAFAPGRLRRCLARAAGSHADILVDNLTVIRESGGAPFPMFPEARLARLPVLRLADFISGNQSFLGGYALGYMKPLFRAGFLQRHALAYHPDLRIGEDYLLLARALACGARCLVDPKPGYLYTSRAGSVSHRLTPGDVDRIAAADRLLAETCRFDPAAARAQKAREFHLREAYAFTRLVEALKRKDAPGALNVLAEAPLAARHLWRPVIARLRRTLSPRARIAA